MKLRCPFCGIVYETRHETKEDAFKTDDMSSREQWITGICSDECFPGEDKNEVG